MDNQCQHRTHTAGKGWKRCTYYAVHEIFAEVTPGEKRFVQLCGKHYDLEVNSGIKVFRDEIIQKQDICPECGSPIEFSKGIPLCSGDHPISGKTQRYFTERYPEYFQQKILEVQGEIK
jgi:hypothetical protein